MVQPRLWWSEKLLSACLVFSPNVLAGCLSRKLHLSPVEIQGCFFQPFLWLAIGARLQKDTAVFRLSLNCPYGRESEDDITAEVDNMLRGERIWKLICLHGIPWLRYSVSPCFSPTLYLGITLVLQRSWKDSTEISKIPFAHTSLMPASQCYGTHPN